ncbi:MAG TPA: penicillin-binding transpeptidase domain-containing protein [Gemmatimonadales bacterium]|nr:penicillin-binding transpeptidase domain-containing protein [Gemmatimonadales bacterium]
MAKPAARIAALQFVFLLAAAVVLGRAAQVQLVQGGEYARRAAAQRTARVVLPARRGAILDRNGVPLAVTQEYYHVGVAPNELERPREAARLIARHLGIPPARVARDLARKRYAYYHGPFTALQVHALREIRGVHLEGQYARAYPSRDLARPIIGGLAADGGRGASGLELALDSLLTGRPGEAVVLKDRAGRRYESPSRLIREPVPGHDVVLTLDAELQDIAERGLEEALEAMEAEGGDVVFLDPRTGELLALASRRAGAPPQATAFTESFEPGSTAKLFTAAALLSRNRVDTAATEDAEDGVWVIPGRSRPLTDSHKESGRLTLAQAISVSSNIVVAKFALRLSPEEQYETLRDFGFGSPTGVEFPSESRGRLARPDRWRPHYSQISMAIGYEFGVTPVQLAVAYGAIANDGVLLSPTLVREIRSPAGEVVYRHRPEPVRQVVTPEVASRLRDFLRGAVGEGGTGERAQMVNYSLLGKTGTAVKFEGGRYVPGEYTASFAALFPAEDPQLVVIVKIDSPKGHYYGGLTAAPVTRDMLQQALAARQVAIRRSRLTSRTESAAAPAAPRRDGAGARPIVVAWPYRPAAPPAAGPVAVPDVIGQSVRGAALALHRRGFRVALRGMGTVVRTSPEAQAHAPWGSTVTVWAEQRP